MTLTIINRNTTTQTGIETYEQALQQLQQSVAGTVILPGDEGYDDARTIRNASINRFPAVVVQAANADDVAQAVRFARRHGLTLSVRSGGHSFAGHSVNDRGMVIDLRKLNAVSVDPESRTARAQPGATSAVLGAAAHKHGLALSTGDTSSVAVGGLATGGGIGWMVRSQGLSIDNLLSAEVVTADGRILTASETENPDLFWAVRGGGGNFGVVTEFEFRLHPTGTVLAGLIGMPATPEVLRGYADWAREAPEELTTICFLMATPPAPFIPEDVVGKLSFMVMPCYAGDVAEGEKLLAQLRDLATPLFELVAPMPYPEIYALTEDGTHRSREHSYSQFLDEMPDEVIAACIDAMSSASPMSFIQIRTLGGAMARVPVEATAFAHRNSNYLMAIVGTIMEDDQAEATARWSGDLFAKVRPYGNGTYVNFLQYDADRLGDAYPPATLARLADIKRRYDPENVFNQNQNIRPAAR